MRIFFIKMRHAQLLQTPFENEYLFRSSKCQAHFSLFLGRRASQKRLIVFHFTL